MLQKSQNRSESQMRLLGNGNLLFKGVEDVAIVNMKAYTEFLTSFLPRELAIGLDGIPYTLLAIPNLE